jgi:molecular chaperone GrpE
MTEHPRRHADGRPLGVSPGQPASAERPTSGDAGSRSEPSSGAEAAAAPAAGLVGAPVTGQTLAGVSSAEEVETLRRELAERNDQLLRLAADFENFRRRKAQELADRSRYAAEDAARALLPVLDNLRRAVEHSAGDGNGQQLQDGLRMVVLQFEQALAGVGVETVETVGARFDPAVHEAIGGEESDAVTEDTVVAELQPGYRLHDRLLRPALVRVAHPRRGAPGSFASEV